MKFSIVVPCYNEEENIPLVLEAFQQAIGERKDIELILVNNGSTDNSQKVLDDRIGAYSFATTVCVQENQGYGYGILYGLKNAKGDFIGWTHADMQTNPKDVIKAVDILLKDKERENMFVKGTRKGRSPWDMLFTNGMSLFESVYLGKKLIDINAQPNVFSRSFFETWEAPPYDFSLDLYALYMAKKQGMKVVRFPVEFPKRIHGSSKWNTGIKSKFRFIKRTLQFSVALKKRGVR